MQMPFKVSPNGCCPLVEQWCEASVLSVTDDTGDSLISLQSILQLFGEQTLLSNLD